MRHIKNHRLVLGGITIILVQENNRHDFVKFWVSLTDLLVALRALPNKHSMPLLLEPLLFVFNLSISSAQFPGHFKCAKVIPIHKRGDPLCGNYHPNSLSPCLQTFGKNGVSQDDLIFGTTQGIRLSSIWVSTRHESRILCLGV